MPFYKDVQIGPLMDRSVQRTGESIRSLVNSVPAVTSVLQNWTEMTEDGSDQRPKWMQVARDMASALIVGVWGYAPSGIQEQSSWSGGLGKKPHEAESCL